MPLSVSQPSVLLPEPDKALPCSLASLAVSSLSKEWEACGLLTTPSALCWY